MVASTLLVVFFSAARFVAAGPAPFNSIAGQASNSDCTNACTAYNEIRFCDSTFINNAATCLTCTVEAGYRMQVGPQEAPNSIKEGPEYRDSEYLKDMSHSLSWYSGPSVIPSNQLYQKFRTFGSLQPACDMFCTLTAKNSPNSPSK
ncbi:hypothetical protein C8R44DRAFT_738236 [Mycena epipterygia]|nr:hypothetical protein C8R44DRAFT_738236 [Mycena epipterygia]